MSASDSSRQYFYSAGKRKNAIARVKMFADGGGAFTVNGMKVKDYFTDMQVENALAPIALIGKKGEFDCDFIVKGG